MMPGPKPLIDRAGRQVGLWSLEYRFQDGFGTPRATPHGFIRVSDISHVPQDLVFVGLADCRPTAPLEYFLDLPVLPANERMHAAESCSRSLDGLPQMNWPIVGDGQRRHARLPIRIIAGRKTRRLVDGYERQLEATDIDRAAAEAIAALQSSIEREAATSVAEHKFFEKYKVRRILTVGSTSRKTYADPLVDFDVVVETEVPQAEIPREDLRRLVEQTVARVALSPAYKRYCAIINQSAQGNTPPALRQSFFDVRGTESFVSRHEIELNGARHNLIDLTIGRLPQLVGYEIWIQRFLAGLGDKRRVRICREIRLAKKLLVAMGGLYGVGIPGFRGSVVEQLVIQGWDYRSNDVDELGSLDNSLRLIAEEIAGFPEGMPLAEYKSKFPLWHPGWWESEVGFTGSQRGVNVLDLLGGGKAELAEQQWKRVEAVATAHSKIIESDRCWTIDEVVKQANMLLAP